MTNLWTLDSVLGNPPQHSQLVEHWWLTFLNLFAKLFELDLSSSTAATASVLCHHVSTYLLRHLLLHDLGWKKHSSQTSNMQLSCKTLYLPLEHTHIHKREHHAFPDEGCSWWKEKETETTATKTSRTSDVNIGTKFHTTQSTREKGFETSKELTTRLRHKEIAYKEKIPTFSKQRLLITQGINHICLSLPSENRPGDANP